MSNQHYDARAHAAAANNESLMALLRDTSISLGSNALQWRPTLRTRGNISGVFGELEILCTDGIVAWFRDAQGVLIYGHISHFSGKVQTLHGVPRPYKPSEPGTAKPGRSAASARAQRKPRAAASDALALLASMLNAAAKPPRV